MTYRPHSLNIYVDGSCLGNPGGPGGIAGIAEYPDRELMEPEDIFQEGYRSTTNNRMELRACIRAMMWCREVAPHIKPSRIVLVTDSRYVHDNQRKVIEWRRLGWTNRDGRPIENQDLWRAFLSTRSKVRPRLDVEWGKGKSDELSNRVDQMAKAAAKSLSLIDDIGFHQDFLAPTKLRGKAAALYPADGDICLVRIYRSSLIGRGKSVRHKIFFEVLDRDSGTYSTKHIAYTSPEIEQQLHRHHHYRVQFNNNARHPIIEGVVEEVVLA